MSYKQIESKYINAKIKGHYLFENVLEVKQVLGFDFRIINLFKKGYGNKLKI